MEKRDRAESDIETALEVPESTKGGAEGENGTVVA